MWCLTSPLLRLYCWVSILTVDDNIAATIVVAEHGCVIGLDNLTGNSVSKYLSYREQMWK